jgi:Sigma-70 region 2
MPMYGHGGFLAETVNQGGSGMAAAQFTRPGDPTREDSAEGQDTRRAQNKVLPLEEIASLVLHIGTSEAKRHPSVKAGIVQVDDMASRAIFAAWRSVATYDPSRGVPLKRYLQMKAQYACADVLRHEQWFSRDAMERENPPSIQFDSSVDLIGQIEAPDSDPCEIVTNAIVTNEVADLIRQVARTRTPWHGEAFMLALDGVPRVEIAQKYQCSPQFLSPLFKRLTAEAAKAYKERYVA